MSCCDVDYGECGDKQHHQDRWSAVQGEVHEYGVDVEAALRSSDDHDRSGPRRIAYQRTHHQFHSPQLARSSKAKLPGRIHHSSRQGFARYAYRGERKFNADICQYVDNSESAM